MPTISTENTDQLTHIITVHIVKEDYEKPVMEELKKLRKKAHLKGFRKGQTPMSYIKKMYGKSVLAEELNRTSYNEVMQYLVDSDIDTLGQPLPVADQEAPDLDVNTFQDYSFQYEIGLKPKIEVQGVDKSTELKLYDIEIEEHLIDENVEKFRKENGVRESKEEVGSTNDILFVMMTELEGDEPKEGGMTNKTSMFSLEDVNNEELKQHILTLKKGDTFDANIYDLVKDGQRDHVHKYMLYVKEDAEFNEMFRIEILNITNITPAEFSAELLQKAVGQEKAEKYISEFLPKEEEKEEQIEMEDSDSDIPEVVEVEGLEEEEKEHVVTDAERKAAEEGFRTEVKEMMQVDFNNNAKARLIEAFRKKIVEKNEVLLPEAYLKRWMEMNNREIPVSDKEYNVTAEGLKWAILKDSAAKKMGVYVSYEEAEGEMKDRFLEMSGMSADDPKADEQFEDFMTKMHANGNANLIANMQSNKIQENVADKLEEELTITKEKISSKAYSEMLEKEYEAEQKKLEEEKEAAKPETAEVVEEA